MSRSGRKQGPCQVSMTEEGSQSRGRRYLEVTFSPEVEPPGDTLCDGPMDTMRTQRLPDDDPDEGGVPLKASVVEGPSMGLERAVHGRFVVGSDPTCHLVLDDPAVSRRHLEIRPHPQGAEVTDLDSTNGTTFSGSTVRSLVVPPGAVLRLGSSAVAIQPAWMVREVPPSPARRFGLCVGESVGMREVFAVLERIAPTDIGVLIQGESGTGKELLSRSVHDASARRDGPYVVVDCGSIPEGLAESELFGHVKGAFSGATSDREGAFRRAHGGTLFLDEIGELPLTLQPRLLRVLETGQVKRVGADRMETVDVRVVAATHRNLAADVVRGSFRQDLLYRLSVVAVRVPPLRERPEDLPLLIRSLLGPDWTPEGDNLKPLMHYHWPGNVRELRNVLQRAVALAPEPRFGALRFVLGPPPRRKAEPGFSSALLSKPFKEAKQALVDRFEAAYVRGLLQRHDGNVSRAAEEAGISRKHLHDLLKRHPVD